MMSNRDRSNRGIRLFTRTEGRRVASRQGLVLTIIGFVLVLLAPAWRWGIAPLLIKLPDNLNNIYTYEGKLTVFADRATSKFYPAGQEVTTPLKITSEDVGVPAMSDSRILVVDERVTGRDATTGEIQTGLRPPTTYALDRWTCENVPGRLPGIDRTGFTIKLPMGARKVLYPIWDDDLNTKIACTYVREGRIDGNTARNVRVYIYRLGGSIEKMSKPTPRPSRIHHGKGREGFDRQHRTAGLGRLGYKPRVLQEDRRDSVGQAKDRHGRLRPQLPLPVLRQERSGTIPGAPQACRGGVRA